jgi:hypothetical protein
MLIFCLDRIEKRSAFLDFSEKCSTFVLMQHFVIRSLAGDAGPLSSPANPALAKRFHFWRGVSGRRYACTVFANEPIPAYGCFVALFVQREKTKRRVIAVNISVDHPVLPVDADEIHIHLAENTETLVAAMRDLSALAEPAPREVGTFSRLPVFAIGKKLEARGTVQLRNVALYKRAASHSNVASRMPSASSSFTVAST